MTEWESGIESSLLDDLIAGRKTIEGRLNRDKFSQYQAGDIVWLRRDIRDKEGILHNGEPRQVCVQVVDVRKYKTSLEMVQAEGYQKVIPRAASANEAAAEYDSFYSRADQNIYGVLAIELKLLSVA